MSEPLELRACLHIACPHHACVNPTLLIEAEDLHREIARLEFRIAALEARPTIQWWPTGAAGWQCSNCKTWISYGTTHLCNWISGGTAGSGGWPIVNTTGIS